MNKAIFKRTVAFLLCLIFVISLSACKKTPSEDSEISVEYIYQYESDDTSTDDNNNGETSNSDNNGTTSSGNKNNGTTSSGNKNNGTTSLNTSSGGSRVDKNKDKTKDLKGREITYVANWDATNRSSENGKRISEVERIFNCKIVERKMSDYKALYTSILAGKPIADLFAPIGSANVLNLANKDMIIPLDTISTFDSKDELWDQGALTESKLNGYIYGMADRIQIREVLAYNKTMFEKNNWPDLYDLQEKGKLTWDVLWEIIQKAATANGSTVSRYGIVPTYHYRHLGLTLIHANGVTAVSRSGDTKNFKYNLSDKASLNALNELNKWASLKGGVYDTAAGGWDSGRNIFYSGKAAMAVLDDDMFGTIAGNANFDIGMVLFPKGPDADKQYVTYTVTQTVMSKGTKNPEDVMQVWTYLQKHKGQYAYRLPNIDALPDPSVKSTLEKYLSLRQNGMYINDFAGGTVFNGIDDVARGKTTPAAAMESMSSLVMSDFTDYWK